MTMQKAAIFGAGGAIGMSVAAELEVRGVPFRAVGRSRSRLETAFGSLAQAEIFDADIGDLRSAGAAARGVEPVCLWCAAHGPCGGNPSARARDPQRPVSQGAGGFGPAGP